MGQELESASRFRSHGRMLSGTPLLAAEIFAVEIPLPSQPHRRFSAQCKACGASVDNVSLGPWLAQKKRWPGSGLRLQSRSLRRSAPSARSPSVARAIGTCKCARLADLSTMATAYRRLPAVSLWESDAAAPCFRGWTMVKPPCMPSCASLLQLTTTGH